MLSQEHRDILNMLCSGFHIAAADGGPLSPAFVVNTGNFDDKGDNSVLDYAFNLINADSVDGKASRFYFYNSSHSINCIVSGIVAVVFKLVSSF